MAAFGGRYVGAGEVSQILAGRKDGCRSERAVQQNGRRLQGSGEGQQQQEQVGGRAAGTQWQDR